MHRLLQRRSRRGVRRRNDGQRSGQEPPREAGWMEARMTFEELEQIAAEARENKEKSPRELNVCVAAGCLSLHSDAAKKALEEEVKRTGATCRVRGTGCMGLCSLGPLVASEPGGQLYKSVTAADAAEIVENLEGAPVARLLFSREQP